MIAYFRCACTSYDKFRIKHLINKGYEVRVIKGNPQWRKEAKCYNLKMPFIVENGIARVL